MGGLIVILLVVLTVFNKPGSAGLGQIESISGITFPANVTNVSVNSTDSAYITAHATIPAADIESFISQNGFKQGKLTMNMMGVNMLDPAYRSIPSTANLLVEGKNGSNRWIFRLDRASGDVWTTVYK